MLFQFVSFRDVCVSSVRFHSMLIKRNHIMRFITLGEVWLIYVMQANIGSTIFPKTFFGTRKLIIAHEWEEVLADSWGASIEEPTREAGWGTKGTATWTMPLNSRTEHISKQA